MYRCGIQTGSRTFEKILRILGEDVYMELNDLMEKEEVRSKLIGNTQVLEKIDGFFTIPNADCMTIDMVAWFYDVDKNVIEQQYKRNKSEFISDGVELVRKKEFIEKIQNLQSVSFENQNLQSVSFEIIPSKSQRGAVIIHYSQPLVEGVEDSNEFIVTNRGVTIFPRRAILRMGMLLQDSEYAELVRSYLLNIEEKCLEESPHIVQESYEEVRAAFEKRIKELEIKVEQLENENQEYRNLMPQERLMEWSEICRILQMGRNQLLDACQDYGIISNKNGLPYECYMEHFATIPNGKDKIKIKLKASSLTWLKGYIETKRQENHLNHEDMKAKYFDDEE